METPTRASLRKMSIPAKAAAKAKSVRGKASSLTEKVYQLLRAQILSGELEPGRELSEAELAEQFGVSKTPVREALATLRSEGFVRTFPRRGYQVVPITFGDVAELFEVRAMLEAGAAELACARITDEELDQLDRLADVAYDRYEQPSLKRFIQANRDFHVAIARASGNERLYQLSVRQIDELERIFYLGARLRDISGETKDDHHEIVRVLRSRDPVAARAIMIRHNDMTRQNLFQVLAASRKASQISL
ncbi:GntR family transcriptional regulator [Microvirga zambiensis]|uniref:GntR family transcriptional regulator n=1 Tax=Microvirga zambiensis TaxID=1402137 RepID=UPI001FE3FA8F|nr:GntR family transcriptional regulator [Microvirga zambiensis]